MRRIFLTLIAATAMTIVGAGPAAASSNGGSSKKGCKTAKAYSASSSKKNKGKCRGDDGNACPPTSKNPGGHPPNCGHPPKDTCHDGKDNDYDGKTDMADEECQNPNDGDENGDDNAPAGNCAKADLVLLTEDVKILCLYFGDNAMNATTAKDCPDALLALPVDSLVGACLFLPPADSGQSQSQSTTAAMPAVQTALASLQSLPLPKLPLLGS
jgi:hypothetical protein